MDKNDDDVAHVEWGGEWKIPTKEQLDELKSNCDWEWTTDYNNTGVKGYIIKNKISSHSIFLPAAYNPSMGASNNGHYWSSSPKTEYPDSDYNYLLVFWDKGYNTQYDSRNSTLYIRAVYKPEE